MNREKKYDFLKALSWYTIGNIAIKAVNFVTLKLFTGILSTYDYGVFGVYQSYLAIFEIIILYGTSHTIKIVKYDNKYDYNKYVSSILFIPVIGTIIFIILTEIGFIFVSRIGDLSKEIWEALFVTAGITAVANIISSKLIIEGRYKLYIVYCFISTVINLSVSIVLCNLLYAKGDVYWAKIIGGLVANLVGCAFLLLFEKITIPSIRYIKMGIVMGAPLFIHAIGTQILIQSDKIIIGQLCSYSEVGLYTVANSIAVIPSVILNSIEHSWSPWFYHALSKKKYKEIVEKNNSIIFAFSIIVCVFILVTPDIVRIVTNKTYWNSLYILIPLSISMFAELIYLIPLNLELYHKKNNAIWIYTMFVAIFNIVFDVVAISIFGYIAGAYVTLLSRLLLFMLHYTRAKRFDRNAILGMKEVIESLLLLFFSGFFTLGFKSNVIIRWIIAVLLCVCFVYRFLVSTHKVERKIFK